VRLPNFLVIGAAKAGTTSLYHYLRQSPGVYMSPIKETNYFWHEGQVTGRFAIQTRAEYEQLFASAVTEKAIGEASPQYLNSPTAPERIHRDLPGVRLIVSLRNPADRAYSGYLGWLRNGRGVLPLREALRPGTEFFEHSLYHPRLGRYFDRFPRHRIKVVLYDDFAARPAAIVRELLEFLDVEAGGAVDTRVVHNSTLVPRSAGLNRLVLGLLAARHLFLPALPAFARGWRMADRLHRLTLVRPLRLPEDLRAELLARFRDDIVRTGDLVGRDLSGWLR